MVIVFRPKFARNTVAYWDAPYPEAKSRILFAYYQGLQTQARIHNKLEVLKDAITGTYELLGIKNADIVAA